MPSLLAKSGSFSIANQIWRPQLFLARNFCLFAEVKIGCYGEKSHFEGRMLLLLLGKHASNKKNGGKFGGSFFWAVASLWVSKDEVSLKWHH